MNSLVSHQVALFHECAAAGGADVLADAHVGAHVAGQLALLGCGVSTVGELAAEHVT